MGLPARSDEVLTPEETFRRHGVPAPAELYERLGHDQTVIVYPPSAPLPPEVAATYAPR